jgi:UTP--glucose-1-phosphate uridylyltransferase
MVSNVDNLGAVLDPLLVGLHLEQRRSVSVEVARRSSSDRGGMPVMMDGAVRLLEGLRWPDDLDDRGYETFNTNTFLIDASVFRDPPPLDAYPVSKQVDGRAVIQFERILGEVTHHVDTTFVVVPARGGASRFIPVKRRQDLEDRRDQIVACLSPWGVL